MAHDQLLVYDKAGNRTREQIDANVNGATFNNVNQLTAQSPSGKMEFTGTLSEFATLTLEGTAASVDNANNWRGTADVTTGANSIALVATDASGNASTHTISITVTGNAARTLTYDLNGNLTNNGAGQTYTWDAANRLTKITYSDASYSTFVYNGLGQRVEITETDASGMTTSDKYFVWAGGAQPVEERDAANTVTKRFYGTGEQIGGVMYFYTTDHLGSIREMTDTTKAIRARYEYDPYGRLTKVSGDLEADFGFTGFYRHTASGLDLTLYRAYDPQLGRWISRDPIGERGGLNLYGYVGGSPINYVDPFGLEVTIRSRDVQGLGGTGAHTWTEVSNDQGRTTFSGIKDNNGNLGIRRDYPSDFNPTANNPETSNVVVPPPAGMTQDQWDKAVIQSGERELLTDGQRGYKLLGGDNGTTSGNCHVVSREIIEGAGGMVPANYDPPGLNPGLH